MFAELHSDRNERKFNVYVLKCANEQLITTIPTLKSEPIHFFPEEIIYVAIPSGDTMHLFETHISDIQKINEVYVLVLSILWKSEKDNIRKDIRRHIDSPASCSGLREQDMRLATVLDVSKEGLKIETTESLFRNTFHIVFENGMKKEERRVKIAWSKKSENSYHYGLQTVF